MAKKLSKDEAYAAFIPELVNEFPEDIRDKVADALRGSTRAKDSFLKGSDYSRFMDEARAEKDAAVAAAAAEIESARSVATKWDEWGKTSYGELSEKTERLQRYEATYGPIDPNAAAKAVPGFSKEEVASMLETKLAERSQQMVAFADVLTDLKMAHRDSWKEPLPTQDLLKFAQDNGVADLTKAYDMFVAPRAAERREELQQEALKRAREEGAREALSSVKLPIGGVRFGNPIIDALNNRSGSGTGKNYLADAASDLNSRLTASRSPVG